MKVEHKGMALLREFTLIWKPMVEGGVWCVSSAPPFVMSKTVMGYDYICPVDARESCRNPVCGK